MEFLATDLPSLLTMTRVGQNHIYTEYIWCFRQGNHQIYNHIRCGVYMVLANPDVDPYWIDCDPTDLLIVRSDSVRDACRLHQLICEGLHNDSLEFAGVHSLSILGRRHGGLHDCTPFTLRLLWKKWHRLFLCPHACVGTHAWDLRKFYSYRITLSNHLLTSAFITLSTHPLEGMRLCMAFPYDLWVVHAFAHGFPYFDIVHALTCVGDIARGPELAAAK